MDNKEMKKLNLEELDAVSGGTIVKTEDTYFLVNEKTGKVLFPIWSDIVDNVPEELRAHYSEKFNVNDYEVIDKEEYKARYGEDSWKDYYD